jgi:hypothetical protein
METQSQYWHESLFTWDTVIVQLDICTDVYFEVISIHCYHLWIGQQSAIQHWSTYPICVHIVNIQWI